MLKFIIGFERKVGISRAACHEHLRSVHGPLVASVPEFTRHVRSYVQNYALPELPELHNPNFIADGMAELCFDSAESFVQAYSEPRYLAEVRPDEANFTNPGRYVATFSREAEIYNDGSQSTVKLIRFLKGRAGQAGVSGRSAWNNVYARWVRESAGVQGLVRRYVQNWSIPSSENPFPLAEPFEGVDEMWFASVADVATFIPLERHELAVSEALRCFDPGTSVALIAHEGIMSGYGPSR